MRSALQILVAMLFLSLAAGVGLRGPAPAGMIAQTEAAGPERRLARAPERFAESRVAAALTALEEAERVTLPFADQRPLLGHLAEAAGYRFRALGQQLLEVRLDRHPVADNRYREGGIYVDLFRVSGGGTENGAVRITDFEIGKDGLSVELPVPGEYVLRLEPDMLVDTRVAIRLELGAVLPFPVQERSIRDIRGFYGDAREGGSRWHTGVDVYAPRATPILAVAEGRAVPGRDALGGRVVRLNAPGVTYYYAHLEQAAIDGPELVEVGDVIGYIGTSGNAARTLPHLHFSIFRWGHGTIDPLPLLRERRFETADVAAAEGSIITDSEIVAAGAGQHLSASNGRVLWLPPAGPSPILATAPAESRTGSARDLFDAGISLEPRIGSRYLVDEGDFLDRYDRGMAARKLAQ